MPVPSPSLTAQIQQLIASRNARTGTPTGTAVPLPGGAAAAAQRTAANYQAGEPHGFWQNLGATFADSPWPSLAVGGALVGGAELGAFGGGGGAAGDIPIGGTAASGGTLSYGADPALAGALNLPAGSLGAGAATADDIAGATAAGWLPADVASGGVAAAGGGAAAGGAAAGGASALSQYGPYVGAGASLLGGLLTRSTTTTSNPTLNPAYSPLQSAILSQIMARLSQPTDLSGYEANGIGTINQSFDAQKQASDNNLSARGLSTSPVAANVDALRSNTEASTAATFRNSVPLLAQQIQAQNLDQANQILAGGRGSTSTTTGGGGAAGAATNLASYLGYLQGKNSFTKPTATGGIPTPAAPGTSTPWSGASDPTEGYY